MIFKDGLKRPSFFSENLIMKKLSRILVLIFITGISSLLVFTPFDSFVLFFTESFMTRNSLSERVSLVTFYESDFRNLGKTPFNAEILEKTSSVAKKLGAKVIFDDFGKNYFASSLAASFASTKLSSEEDELFFRKNLVLKKGGDYEPCELLEKILEFLGKPEFSVTDKDILVGDTKIPISYDGSVFVKVPKEKADDFRRVSFSDLYKISVLEGKLHSVLKKMNSAGLFGELNSQSPLEAFEKSGIFEKKFFILMDSYLTGKQERILLENLESVARSRAEQLFSECRTLFYELKDLLSLCSPVISGTLCVFDLSGKKSFLPNFSYIFCNMILNEDFVRFVSPVFSVLAAFLFSLAFFTCSSRVKKFRSLLAAFFLWISVFFAAFFFFLLRLSLFSGFVAPFSSLILVFLWQTASFRKKRNSCKKNFMSLFVMGEKSPSVKKLFLDFGQFFLEGESKFCSILSVSIREIDFIRKVLGGSQLVAFLNYYFEEISSAILSGGGIIENFRDDEIFSVFGLADYQKNHYLLASETALSVKKIEKERFSEISKISSSPKPDGMSDDLYTAMFILARNKIRITLSCGIWSGKCLFAGLGSSENRLYRIADSSWKKALKIKDAAGQTGTSGIFVSENVYESLKDSFIMRRLGGLSKKLGAGTRLCEILGSLSSDDEKLWNYASYWDMAVEAFDDEKKEKAFQLFKKLGEARPGDALARYFLSRFKD